MSKIKLNGLTNIVRNQDKTIRVALEESCKEINIDILDKENHIVNGVMTDNLIVGLVICSNYYLSENEEQEPIKKCRTKLDKLIRKGAKLKIKTMDGAKEYIELIVNVEGKDTYHFYGKDVADSVRMAAQDCNYITNINRL